MNITSALAGKKIINKATHNNGYSACPRDTHHTQIVVFKTKFKPNKKYKTQLKTTSRTEIEFIADQEIMDRIKSQGIELPMITESKTNMATNIITQSLDENGEFPATMEYGKMISTTTISGKTTTEEKPYSGMKILGKYDIENKFKVDTIIGDKVSQQMRTVLKTTLESVQETIKFPKKPMKVGDEIILNSSFGQVDKITIISVENYSVPSAPFSIVNEKVLKVKAKREIVKKSEREDLYCVDDKGETQYIHERDYTYGRFSNPFFLLSYKSGIYEFGISQALGLYGGTERNMSGQKQIDQYNAYEIEPQYRSTDYYYHTSYWWWQKKYGIIKYGLLSCDTWQVKEINGVDVFKQIAL